MTREAHDEAAIESVPGLTAWGSASDDALHRDKPGQQQQDPDSHSASPATLGPAEPTSSGGSVTVDCDRCCMRGIGCGDCVVTVLLGGPPFGVELDVHERRAIDALATAGLIPPLRMVQAVEERHVEPA